MPISYNLAQIQQAKKFLRSERLKLKSPKLPLSGSLETDSREICTPAFLGECSLDSSVREGNGTGQRDKWNYNETEDTANPMGEL